MRSVKSALRREVLLDQFAWRNRRVPTESEAKLWEALRAQKLGVAFRRQVVIGGRHIVDFAAPALKLVVEVDGGYHRGRRKADARRDRAVMRLGWRVVRVDARAVVEQFEQAVGTIIGEVGLAVRRGATPQGAKSKS